MEHHYTRFWGPLVRRIDMSNTPIEPVCPGFSILVFAPKPNLTAYCTSGMSLPGDAERLELFVLSRPTPVWDRSVADILAATAHYHRTGVRLGMGHTVNFGMGIVADASCDHGLLSLPYLGGPALEHDATTGTRCLWLIPITEAEREFKKAHGLDAFEEALERTNFDYLDWNRRSVVGLH